MSPHSSYEIGMQASPQEKATLGLTELIALGVGGMIGGGIFSILGLAVAVSGNAAPLAFGIGGAIAALAGYSYVRLALTYRSDGASFTYLEKAFPERLWVAGIAGWTIVLGYIGTLALYAFTFGAYAAHLFGVQDLAWARPLLTVGSLLAFLGVNLAGTGAMGKAEDIAVYVKLLLLGGLAVAGFYSVEPTRFEPLFSNGATSVVMGGALVFVAFEGFQLITNAVCETRDPARNIPRGIFGSIAITSVVYVAIAVVAVGNLDTAELLAAEEYALAAVVQPILGKLGVVLIDIAAILATSSAINATIFGASHLVEVISRDQLAPKALSVRNRSGVPALSALVIVLVAVPLALLGGLELIASFSSLTFLLITIAVSVANLRLRKETRTAVLPVYVGIVLMVVTVALLLAYLVQNDVATLMFSVAVYGSVAVGFAVSSRLR